MNGRMNLRHSHQERYLLKQLSFNHAVVNCDNNSMTPSADHLHHLTPEPNIAATADGLPQSPNKSPISEKVSATERSYDNIN